MEQYLDAANEDVIAYNGNSTKLSRFCEDLIKAFLSNQQPMSRVRHFDIQDFDFETLYMGLYRMSSRKDFAYQVKVTRRDGFIWLVRIRSNLGNRNKI